MKLNMTRFIKHLNEESQSDKTKEVLLDIIQTSCQPFLKEMRQNNIKDFLYRGVNYGLDYWEVKKTRTDRKPKDTKQEIHELLDDLFLKKFGWRARSQGVFTIGDKSKISQKGYGHHHIFFPIGKYKYLWSPLVEDLYVQINMGDYCEFDEYEAREDWNEMFGFAGSGHGKTKLGKWVYKKEEEYSGNIEYEDLIDMLKSKYGKIKIGDVKWIPLISLEDYWKEKREEWKVKRKAKIKDNIISTYEKNGLKKAIESGHEIMFSCKEYLLINPSYHFLKELL
jgi:hypothetical protein